ncbi:MAG: hypothetical protein LBJ60_06265, partial [Tannerellaceae bacterium]|nr:hypothetical protein [Tannerellaceae bacterium]
LIRLEAEREKAITDLTNTYNKERKEFALNLKIDSINAQLETVIVGSEREYQLKKELVETQNELEKTGIEYTEQNTKDREALIAAANARELAAKEKLEKDKAAAEIRHNAQQSVNANEKQAAQNDLKMATNGESHKDNWKLKKENDQLELDSIALQLEANQNLWDKQLISEEEYLNTRHSLEMEAMQKRVDMARKEEDQKRELIQATLGTIQEAISFSAGMFKDVSDQRLNVLQSDMEREKEEYEGNKMAQEAVERKYNARMRQEKRKQAVIDKQVAVFDAIIKAYQAYNAALTIPVAGPALAAINLALGLAQAMYIQAKPIPEFWRGSQNTPQGLAKVFERGGELIEYKGQRYYGDKPAIVDLPRGAKVYPNWHEKTKEFERLSQVTDLKNFYLNNAAEITGKREIISLESRKLDEGAISAAVSKAIRGIPVFQTIFDERGVTTYIGRVASCRELQHERIRTGGNG